MRLLLIAEAAAFMLAASAHLGWMVSGYEHMRAATAESVIAAVLLLGLALTIALPARARAFTLAPQILALIGTLIGVVVVIIGIGPQSVPDMIYHAAMLILLGGGILKVWTRGSERA